MISVLDQHPGSGLVICQRLTEEGADHAGAVAGGAVAVDSDADL